MNLKEWYNAQPIKRRGQIALATTLVFIALCVEMFRAMLLTGDSISHFIGL